MEDETEEEKFERKQRQRQLELESDLTHATDLFAGASVTSKSPPPACPDSFSLTDFADLYLIEPKAEESVESMTPKTRVEFEAYRKRLAEIILANSVSGGGNGGGTRNTYVYSFILPR
jgi:translation initiation factor 3 subunit J